MPAIGELVRCTDGRWMVRGRRRVRCPRGQRPPCAGSCQVFGARRPSESRFNAQP
jgi:hypothetical protein